MKFVKPSLRPADKGGDVGNLQDALRWLYTHRVFKTYDAPNRPTAEELKALFEKLTGEQATQSFGEATRQVLRHFQIQQGLGDHLLGVVEETTAERLNKLLRETGAVLDEGYRVFGQVTDIEGAPQAGVYVSAWDRDLRRRQPLGKIAKTDASGQYLIAYEAADFASADPGARTLPWLIVEARRDDGGPVLGSLEIRPAQVRAVQQVDLQIARLAAAGEVEYERIRKAVLPLLAGQGQEPGTDLASHELGQSDLAFLVEETGFGMAALQAYADGARMLHDALALLSLEEDAEHIGLLKGQGSAWCFALARQNLASTLPKALQRGADDWAGAYAGAVAAHQVWALSPKILQQLQDALAQLKRLQQIQATPNAAQPVAKVLSVVGSTVPRAVALKAQEVIDKIGTVDPDAVLKALSDALPGDTKESAKLVRGLRLHQLADGNDGLMRVLHDRMGDGDHTLAPLAAMPAVEWVKLSAAAGAAPEYAVDMQRRVELQHPVPALQMRIEGGHVKFSDSMAVEVQALLSDKPERVQQLIAGQTPVKDASLSQPEVVLKQLGTSMRLGFNMELVGHFAEHGYLKPTDFMHADVDVLKELADKWSPELNTRDLIERYRDDGLKFVEVGKDVAISIGVHGRSPGHFFGDTPIKKDLTDSELGNLPDLPSLFGDLDECSCRPCESMLGQPAYLVDLLELLRGAGQGGRSPALDALIGQAGRRPDIARLQLNCENSERVVTHIELVLEILQQAREHGGVNADALLTQAPFPWNLPYEPNWARAAAYSESLAYSHDDLLRLMNASDALRAATTLDLPCEGGFGGSATGRREWVLLTQVDQVGVDLYTVYGLRDTMPAGFIDPASGEDLAGKTAAEVLRRISILLERTGLDLDQFEALVATEYVGEAAIDRRDQCKTSQMRLVAPASRSLPAVLNRIHRMVRLQAKLPDLSFHHLDRLLKACGLDVGVADGSVSHEVMVNLACVQRICKGHRVAVEILAELPLGDIPLAQIIDRLAPSFGLRPFQFRLLAQLGGLELAPQAPSNFDWLTFEALLRWHVRVDEAGLTVEDLALAALPDDVLTQWLPAFPVSHRSRLRALDELQEFQRKLREALSLDLSEPQEPRARAIQLLHKAFAASDAAFIVAAIDDAAAEDDKANPADRVPLSNERRRRFEEFLTTSTAAPVPFTLMDANGAAGLIGVADTVATNGGAVPLSAESRYQLLLDALVLAWQRKTLVSALGEYVGLPQTDAADLVAHRLMVDDLTQAHSLLLGTGFISGPLPVSETSPLVAWWTRMRRLQALRSAAQTMLFDTLAPFASWHRLLSDGLTRGDPASLQRWLAGVWLGHVDRLSSAVLASALSLTSDSAETAITAVLNQVAARLEIPQAHVLGIAGLRGIDADASARDAAETLNDPLELQKLYELLWFARTLRADAAQLSDLAGLSGPEKVADAAVALLQVRYQYAAAAWTASEQRERIEGPLRRLRRDALVASLIQTPPAYAAGRGWRTANDLYAYYLIDPMVEPCMKTTPVLEAITSVQLFCQRLLFGLESGLTPTDQLRQQWSWMRNYRVWEANRKVFLFPENWLYPELRDDQSTSFIKLSSELGRGELTVELAEASFGKFLDDLTADGSLVVVSLYEDVARSESGELTKRDLYVLARTPNPPHAYFWRRCSDFGAVGMEWTGWKLVELEISSEHVLAFVLNGVLNVAWLSIVKIKKENGETQQVELTIFKSRLGTDNWTKPAMSRVPFVVRPAAFRDDRYGYVVRVRVEANDGRDQAAVSCFGAIAQLQAQAPGKRYISDETELLTLPPALPAPRSLTIHTVSPDSHGPYNLWPPEFGQADRSAIRELSWECWIKLNTGRGYGWMQLDASHTHDHLIQLRSDSGSPALPLGGTYAWVDLGDSTFAAAHSNVGAYGRIEASTWHVFAEFHGPEDVHQYTSETISCQRVDTGRSRRDHLIFNIDASTKTAEDLGLEYIGVVEYQKLVEFVLDDTSAIGNYAATGDLLVPPDTAPFANGFLEDAGGNRPLFLESYHADGQFFGADIFPTTGLGRFLAIPADSNRDIWESPSIWHFQERGGSVFIDFSPRWHTHAKEFRLLPTSFNEVQTVAASWRRSKNLPEGDMQVAFYGADLVPAPGPLLLPDTFMDDVQKQGQLTFDPRLPQAFYAWEMYFHTPMLIADRLSKQHKFEDAERWLRYVFDPTSLEPGNDPRRYFKFRPFRRLEVRKQVVDDLKAIAQVAGDYRVPSDVHAAADKIDKIIERWRAMPFRPFVIARGRIVAFLWRTLFAYLDNLIAWADSLYRQDTRESNNEAMMLYVMAHKILGRKPKLMSGISSQPGKTYAEIANQLDDFANYWVDAGSRRSTRPLAKRPAKGGATTRKPPVYMDTPTSAGMLLFCMPYNDKLASYWSTVESRLFNLRHCRNIDGVARDLPFTEAPIDPELLVRAVAAGLDLDSVLAGLYAPPPHYRYTTLAARASELVAEARSLGGAMLSALEKRDAEQLAQLRSTNELLMLKLTGEVRKLQVQEASANIAALRSSRQSTVSRYEQYQRLLGLNGSAPQEGQTAGVVSMLGQSDSGSASKRSGLGLIREENEQYLGIDAANTWSVAAGISKAISGATHAGAAIAVVAGWADPKDTGYKIAEALANGASALGDGFSLASQLWRIYADQQGMLAGHLRRRDDWAFQNNQALKELQQIDKQILANQIRIDITQKELDNHLEQIEQSKALDEVLRSKFTNAALYEWMGRELFSLYDKTYRLALQLARQAERAFERDLGPGSLREPVIRNNHWNSQRDGLLAAERLHHDLKRLELAFLEQNKREFELTRHVSLRRLAPQALLELRATNTDAVTRVKSNACEFEIPEWLFDLDTPGHHIRRIKAVSVSIPCVTGPYTSVHCKLTLLGSSVRVKTDIRTATAPGYARDLTAEDPRFQDYYGASDAIVTSTGAADSGLFETQLRDERFLPFEGHGVVSRWRLELPADFPQFDYTTISDVVLTIRYTARDGGEDLKRAATATLSAAVEAQSSEPLPAKLLLSCRTDFPEVWGRRSQGLDLAPPVAVLPYWMVAAKMLPATLSYAGYLKRGGPTGPKAITLEEIPSAGTGDPLAWTPGSDDMGRITHVSPLATDVDDLLLIFDMRTRP